MKKLDTVFEFTNEWSQLFWKCNWYSVTIIELSFENDIMCPGFELHFTLLGLGFYFRINRSWGGTEIERIIKETENGETISSEELKKEIMTDKIEKYFNNLQTRIPLPNPITIKEEIINLIKEDE